MKKSFKRNVVFNVLLNVTNVLFPLVTAPYISRVLGADNLGLSNFATTYVTYFTIFAALGLNTYGVREIAKVKDNIEDLQRLFGELFSISLFSTIVVSAVYLLTIFFIPYLNNNLLLLLVAGVVLFTQPFNVEWFFMGTEKFDFIAIRSIIVKLLSLLALFLFVRRTDDVVVYVLISVMSIILNQFWNFIVLSKSNIKIKVYRKSCFKHINYLLVFLVANIATSAYNYIDVIMLGFISELKEVAFYSNSVHITKMIVSLTASVAIVGLPRISNLYVEKRFPEIQSLLDKAISLISFLVFPVTIAIVVISPSFVPCFFGDEYVGGVVPLQILSLVIILIGFSYICSTMVLVSMGKEKVAVKNTVIGACANVVINAFLIPRLGAIGASIASVAAESIILFLNIFYDLRYFDFIKFDLKPIWRNLLASLVLLPLFFLCDNYFEDWSLIMCFTISGAFLYLIVQYLSKNEFVEEIVNLTKRIIR